MTDNEEVSADDEIVDIAAQSIGLEFDDQGDAKGEIDEPSGEESDEEGKEPEQEDSAVGESENTEEEKPEDAEKDENAPKEDAESVEDETEGMKPKTAERFTKLKEDYESVTAERDEVTTERDTYKEQVEQFTQVIQHSGASDQEFLDLVEFSHKMKSGDPAMMREGLKQLDDMRGKIALVLGEELPGVDLLSPYPDLTQKVDAFEISREDAVQIAAYRNSQAQHTQNMEQQRTTQQETDLRQQSEQGALSAIVELEKQWTDNDADYGVIKPKLIEYAQTLRASNIDPQHWVNMVTNQYSLLKDTMRQAAASVKQTSNVETLRPKKSSNTVSDPKSIEDIAWNQLQNM